MPVKKIAVALIALLPPGFFDAVVQAVASYGVGTSPAYNFKK